MFEAVLTFSDGSTLKIKNGQRLKPLTTYKENDRLEVSKDSSFEILFHHNAGLIPHLCEFLVNCEYFFLENDNSTVYKSSSVKKIKNL